MKLPNQSRPVQRAVKATRISHGSIFQSSICDAEGEEVLDYDADEGDEPDGEAGSEYLDSSASYFEGFEGEGYDIES